MKAAGLESRRVAGNFSRAAASYDDVAIIQKYALEGVVDRLDLISLVPRRILDLGSGTGAAGSLLAAKYPRIPIYQLDIAHGMLLYATHADNNRAVRSRRICAAAEQLPLRQGSMDMVISSLMLQWSTDVDALFMEVRSVLAEGGLFIFSTLGPGTLMELRQAWAAVDDQDHVNTFLDMHDLGDALLRSGFVDPVMESDRVTLRFGSVAALMRDLKLLGAANALHGRRRSLTGKSRLRGMMNAYENHRDAAGIPASFEVVYGHAWVPAMGNADRARASEKRDGVFRISVESLLRGLRGKRGQDGT